jgi:hypothetical protein
VATFVRPIRIGALKNRQIAGAAVDVFDVGSTPYSCPDRRVAAFDMRFRSETPSRRFHHIFYQGPRSNLSCYV